MINVVDVTKKPRVPTPESLPHADDAEASSTPSKSLSS
jgi:hypothetical protein